MRRFWMSQIFNLVNFYLGEKHTKIGRKKKRNWWRRLFASVTNAASKSSKKGEMLMLLIACKHCRVFFSGAYSKKY